jgi:hypothetical protein
VSKQTSPVNEEFKRSRIYAQGWNAASKLTTEERDQLDPAQIAKLNPYAVEDERARWTDGFVEALGK